MALKKPSDLFGNNKLDENNTPVVESDNSFREELDKVESLSEQVLQLQQELSQKVIKNDLETLVISQINTMKENFEYLQNDFKKSNKKDIVDFKEKVSELTEIVGNLVENELPKYKKQVTKNEIRIGDKFDELKEVVEENIVGIREEIDSKVNDIAEVIDNNLEYFNNQLQETSTEVKKTTDTYNKLSKILENKVSKENEKLEEYSQIIQSLHEAFVELEKSLQEETSTYNQIIEEKFETISSDVKNKIDSIGEDVDAFKIQVSSDISSIKSDVVINEQHIKNVDKYLKEYHQELVELKEEVFDEIEKLPVGDLQENLNRLEKKIDYIKETYSKIEPEVIVKEVIGEGLLNIPPNTKNTDPLTPLDQKFVTLDQLQEHYRLFINRIQQQISTLGGGGETRLRYLDDIVGVATNSSAYDGKVLQWNSTTNKSEFNIITLNKILGYGNTSSLGMVVGVVTAQQYYGDASNLSKTFPLVSNVLYVSKNGNDTNPGTRLSEPKATIAGAVAAAKTSGTTAGTVIKVSAGTYIENNPITLPDQISIIGDGLREVSVTPQNTGDLFYVGTGNYIAQMSFVGSANTGAIVSFNPNNQRYINQSPYIQNCTNFIPNSIGLRIDGKNALGPLKSMVLDSYTQYNQGGIGCSITNEGYAQLVSMFTICNNIAVYCGSGGACDLTNSNSSFGNYGFVADGVSPLKYAGINTSFASADSDTFTLNLSTPTYSVSNALYDNTTGVTTITTSVNHNFQVGMGVTIAGLGFSCLGNPGAGVTSYPSGNNGYIFEVKSVPSPNKFIVNVGVSTTPNQVYVSGGTAKINVVRPFDGQSVYFGELYNNVGKIIVGSGGTGYTSAPIITIDPPSTSWGIQAVVVAEVKNGSITNINFISNGRGYTTLPSITVSAPNVGVNTATLTAELTPSYYSIQSATPISSGISTITISENLPYAVGVGTTIAFFKQSRILASGHSFEYIGSGTTIATCLPSTGGIAIQANETDPRNGGLVVYTSTDHTGNFRIGDGVVINQQTGTISGTSYSKSLFSTVTPFILALGGGR